MPAPEIIHQLVQQFTDNRDAYRSGRYNEAQLRQEFLNPFFEALGWDVSNRKGFSINYREVVHEDSIHIKGSPHAKAPDYAFRLGGVRKFFVEAKKPAEDIQFDRELAYQLKVYAWNVGLPISILTDFEEFAVYDCRNKPNPSDSPAAARIMYIRFDQYLEKWDELENIFSPTAIQKGAFDRYVADTSSKKGTTHVDDAFLADIEEWRTLLARNIALRNQHVVNERQLNYAVQMTIDRIIFLRICEDRGIEPTNQLLELSKSKDIYPQMVQLFQRADLKYNSGLFHFKSEKGESNHADKLTPHLVIDDKVLKEIIKDLYYPCPYIFKEIPVEILGQVYEQFLGKVIRLTPGHKAVIEEKPEVRKAGGVYYTPSYIVDYIVANTVGKLVEGKSPEQVSQLKIVDPACGSGSFLLGAFQYLLDWHESWYLANQPEKWAKGKQPALIPTEGGDWKLTTAEKKRILVNNIYGVDIDAQAVEVTKLSLLLKVLEEESGQLSLGLERVLPDLGDNIKCGNSLIGWDYFEGQLIPDEKELERVNPFDWQRNFPQVFARGGFDAVIGNPPYGAEYSKSENNYLFNKFKNQEYQIDSYLIFMEQSLIISRGKGSVGVIIPNTWLLNLLAIQIRKHLFENTSIESIVHYIKKVFVKVTVDTEVVIFRKQFPQEDHFISIEIINKDNSIDSYKIPQFRWIKTDGKPVNIFEKEAFSLIANKLKLNPILDVNYLITQGTKPFQVGKGKPPQTKKIVVEKPYVSTTQIDPTFKPLLRGSLINKYRIIWKNDYWISFGDWLAEPRYSANFDAKEKIIIRQTGDSLIATLDKNQFIVRDNLYTIVPRNNENLKYLLGLINSSLLNWFYQKIVNPEKGEALAQVKRGHIALLPIRTIVFTNPMEVEQHDRMVALVERMLELHKRDPQTPQEADRLQREIAATDAAIDKLVYELYGLTEEEVRIVETGTLRA